MDDLRALAPRPAHIPEAAVYDYDMFLDAPLLQNPHERIRQMIREAPSVFWTPRNGGMWTAIGYPEIFEAARDPERFTSRADTPEARAAMAAVIPPNGPRLPQQTPISLDPPDHTKFRAPLNPVFGPRAMAARTEEIRTLANELIDAVAADGHCDFIASIAEPLPVTIFMKLMGLPLERLMEFRHLVHQFLAPGMTIPSEAYRRARLIADAMGDTIQARKDDPKDDLISLLWRTEVEGRPVDYDLMEDYCSLLFIAGLDTVINGMGYGIRHMALHPETQNALRADPTLIPDAVEEMLRRYSFTIPMRRVARDTELGGQQLKAGDWVALYIPAADLDPREFDKPEIFDLGRENNSNLAFGAGPHRCLGSHLARIELRVLYEQVLAKLPTFRLDPGKPVTFRGGHIIAVESLPIRWD